MKFLKYLFVFILFVGIANSQEFFKQSKKIIPAKYAWVFKEEDLSKILIEYLKSHGTNVPDGEIEISGLESHYNYGSNKRLELIIEEKH